VFWHPSVIVVADRKRRREEGKNLSLGKDASARLLEKGKEDSIWENSRNERNGTGRRRRKT